MLINIIVYFHSDQFGVSFAAITKCNVCLVCLRNFNSQRRGELTELGKKMASVVYGYLDTCGERSEGGLYTVHTDGQQVFTDRYALKWS